MLHPTHAEKLVSSFNSRSRLALALLALAVASLTGCTRTISVTVPVMESPRAQYLKAVDYQEQRNLSLIGDDDNYMTARETVRQTYAKVVEYFPEDRYYTPLAKLQIIEMEAGLDSPRVRRPAAKLRDGIERLSQLSMEYPEFEFIQVKTLFQQGQSHRLLQEFPDAQECFRMVRDDFKDSKDPHVKELVHKAAYFYNQVEVFQKN